MGELTPVGSGIATRESRRTTREITRIGAQGQVSLARINQQAELNAERVSAVTYVGNRALHEVALLSQLELQLSALVPAARPRLQGIADITALSVADVVSDTVRRVR